jgi:Tfp pilus assembly protein PilN
MIQLNLLPDVKLDYIKARRNKRTVMLFASLVIVVSIGLFIMMLTFVGAQRLHLSNLDKDIDSGVAEIQNTPEIDKVLTVQNQLSVLNAQHDQKPAVTRVLPYFAQLLPPGASITTLNVDLVGNAIGLSGKAANINDINKVVDTLKFAEYRTKSGQSGKPFSDIVLGGSGIGDENSDSGVSVSGATQQFTVSMKFDPILFNNLEEVEITVPGMISTRSSTEKPNISFDKQQTETEGGDQ